MESQMKIDSENLKRAIKLFRFINKYKPMGKKQKIEEMNVDIPYITSIDIICIKEIFGRSTTLSDFSRELIKYKQGFNDGYVALAIYSFFKEGQDNN